MKLVLAILFGCLTIAAAILFIGRWEISAVPGDTPFKVFRLDRWTGTIDYCSPDVRIVAEGSYPPTVAELFAAPPAPSVFPVKCHRPRPSVTP